MSSARITDRVRTEALRLEQLRPWAENPRRISAEARAGLRASLERFGLVEPVVVNRHGDRLEVISGHQRLELLREAGVATARCVVVSLPEAEARALALSLNNRAIQGDFTEDVAALIEDLRGRLGEDVAADLRLAELRSEPAREIEQPAGGLADPDAIPAEPAKPRSRRGDLWQLGPHRLVCGDATDADDVRRALAGRSADLVFTDPPYNMAYRSKRLGGILNDALADAAFLRLLLASARRMLDALRPGGGYYVCMSSASLCLASAQLRKLGMVHRAIVWEKPCPGLGSQDYRPAHEMILYGARPPRSRRTWRAGREEGDVWAFDPARPVVARREGRGMVLEFGSGIETVQVRLRRASTGEVLAFDGETSDVWKFGRERGGYLHPTQKPVVLVERALRNSSRAGDLVLDSFAGSGTTLIACERLGRCFAGLELDPARCDVAVRRWEDFTGRKAERQSVRRSAAKSGRGEGT